MSTYSNFTHKILTIVNFALINRIIARNCDRHELGLLTKCTNCETPFPIPAD
ncbi:hypothetical protein H6G96_10240 [Nostoc sp. FACHB-892]|uniref:hypothetical protein n=1 Tax=Nostoc sp. FACHB-892 TaxID=2692843 RepID=UPI001682C5F1|nr:hypothetical protein [Nostoc sp. FACHB-892]MBD2726699.1 hypothetical protein [Nostoc sp. FACHB-892]